jgi:hypothetical protein
MIGSGSSELGLVEGPATCFILPDDSHPAEIAAQADSKRVNAKK